MDINLIDYINKFNEICIDLNLKNTYIKLNSSDKFGNIIPMYIETENESCCGIYNFSFDQLLLLLKFISNNESLRYHVNDISYENDDYDVYNCIYYKDYSIIYNYNINFDINIFENAKNIYNNRIKYKYLDKCINVSYTGKITYLLNNKYYTKEEFNEMLILNFSEKVIAFPNIKEERHFPYKCPIYKHFLLFKKAHNAHEDNAHNHEDNAYNAYNHEAHEVSSCINEWYHKNIPYVVYENMISNNFNAKDENYEELIEYLNIIEMTDIIKINNFDFNYINIDKNNIINNEIHEILENKNYDDNYIIFNIGFYIMKYYDKKYYEKITKKQLLDILIETNNSNCGIIKGIWN